MSDDKYYYIPPWDFQAHLDSEIEFDDVIVNRISKLISVRIALLDVGRAQAAAEVFNAMTPHAILTREKIISILDNTIDEQELSLKKKKVKERSNNE